MRSDQSKQHFQRTDWHVVVQPKEERPFPRIEGLPSSLTGFRCQTGPWDNLPGVLESLFHQMILFCRLGKIAERLCRTPSSDPRAHVLQEEDQGGHEHTLPMWWFSLLCWLLSLSSSVGLGRWHSVCVGMREMNKRAVDRWFLLAGKTLFCCSGNDVAKVSYTTEKTLTTDDILFQNECTVSI